jgi:DNA-binding response OmpR family regulator
MLTARSQVDDKVSGLTNGADDYLTKPFAFEELLARIKALSRRPKLTETDRIEVGALVVNRETFEVTLGKSRLDLSAKEYQLLVYLARNKGKILTKDQIREHVWDYEADILPNTIEVYIKKLREKGIEIETIRGFGYKLGEKDV